MMVVETSEHGISAVAESKARKWRDKIFSKEKDSKAVRDAQIDDFLGSSRIQPQSQPRAPPRPGVPSPRIDVSVSQRSHVNVEQPLLDSSYLSHNTTSPVKRRRRKGLKVQFSNDPPEVMGEGGDEAEAPTKDMIAVYRTRSNSSASTFTDRSDSSPVDEHSPSEPHSYRHGIPPSIAVQHQSPVSEQEVPWQPLLMQNSQDTDFLLSLGESVRGSRLSLRQSSDPNSFARRVQAKMRAEEGRAFQKHFDEEGDSPTDTTSPAQSYPTQAASDLPKTEEKSSPPSFWSSVLSALPDESQHSRRPSPPSSNATPTSAHINNPPASYKAPRQPSPPFSNANPTPTHASATPASYTTTRPPPYLKSPESSTASTQQSFQSFTEDKDSSSSKNLRNVASMVSDTALSDFSDYVNHFNKLFSLSAESVKPSMETSLSEWVRACVWWFLKGRGELEVSIRSRPSSSGGNSSQASPGDQSQQAVVNLAKAWWINQTIVPQHPELSRFGKISTDEMLSVAKSTGDLRIAHLITLHQNVIRHLRGLAMSMKRHNILPSGNDAPPLLQSVDTSVWIKYPFFAPDISAILSGSVSKSMLVDMSTRHPDLGDVMPMGDTSRYFCYGRMFVEAHISSGDDASQQIAIPCMLSITRNRKDSHVIATITSQSELVNITIQADKKQGPTWADVDWHVRGCTMRLQLPRGFELDVHFRQPDFNMIWKIVEYSRKVEASFKPEAGEKLIFEEVLDVFQYMDPRPSKAFPPEPSPRCRIRLFEKTVKITEGTGTRESHRGYRFIAVTSPKVKSLTSVSHFLGNGAPVVFGYLRGDNGAPALMLKVQDGDALCSMILTFSDAEHRSKMHSLLLGIIPSDDELQTAEIPLKSFSIEQPIEKGSGGLQSKTPLKFTSPSITVINQNPSLTDHGYAPTILSERLRAFVSSNWGSVTDRINLGPGDLRIGLDVNVQTAMTVYRPPQNDLAIAVAENLVPKELPDELASLLKTASSKSLVRRYNFASVQALHTFQQAITGFKVRFDGYSTSFAISRRRMVVPIYKKWEAGRTRLQIIEQEKIVQLVVFFSDFSHGKCMNFVLKSTDNFESSSRPGKYAIKLVDAKFALPRGNDDEFAEFVCLDMPEYPGEHDDITIYFDSENDRFNFQSAIPGSVKSPLRASSFKR
ncbi:uncharacterized protein CIMG_04452 [Coccidioides immitis RS]|uniref:Uncharacterized protein n=3 Tax=Coccidioides immitis TaxID=5501 RepID=J3KDI5_COCIM|nr:uncharacterized protein CIMG_04452 [Coccidioides immitis RS]EAS33428.3 hypothetical protein CIMG_04452 [Coccidioides immitis RS]TPX21158.1 hypothetical protein DIZ76_015112 [Coccidioides immitis]